jgi:hypothetical protein
MLSNFTASALPRKLLHGLERQKQGTSKDKVLFSRGKVREYGGTMGLL